MSTTVTTTGSKKCSPFLLKVMIFSPEAGFKFDVSVQLLCSPTNDKTWKLLFNLYKKIGTDFVQVVGVEFQAQSPAESQALETMSNQGVNVLQSRALRTKVHPAVKPLADGHEPTPAETTKIHTALQKAVLLKV
jgi:hypothetical protein